MFANSTTNFTVQVNALNGFNDSVALSITNLPPGVSASFSSPAVSGAGTSTLTLTVSNNAVAGNYTLTILGANGGLTSGATVNLVINSTALPSPWADTDVGETRQIQAAGVISMATSSLALVAAVMSGEPATSLIIFSNRNPATFSITARVISQTATGSLGKSRRDDS